MIPILLAAACTVTGVLAGICIGAAIALPNAHRRVVQRAWTGGDRNHRRRLDAPVRRTSTRPVPPA
ncbi:hypothetical protein [Streptomyces sp. NPDC059928]|uniref:hypothetical protein n=1 Tax=unclassified Streptomyces TaxID=2593676 RepID=UPI00364A053F